MKIFVGNLSPEVSEDDLKQAAEAYGQVNEVLLSCDEAGASKGFGFVVFEDKTEAQAMIAGLHEQSLKGQKIRVTEARPEFSRSGKNSQSWAGLGGRKLEGSKQQKSKSRGGRKGYAGGHVGGREG